MFQNQTQRSHKPGSIIHKSVSFIIFNALIKLFSMANLSTVRLNITSEFCKATKEDLLAKKKNPLDVDDDCPICARRAVLCEVGCHPSINAGISSESL